MKKKSHLILYMVKFSINLDVYQDKFKDLFDLLFGQCIQDLLQLFVHFILFESLHFNDSEHRKSIKNLEREIEHERFLLHNVRVEFVF